MCASLPGYFSTSPFLWQLLDCSGTMQPALLVEWFQDGYACKKLQEI
jgi:hypothetical protein